MEKIPELAYDLLPSTNEIIIIKNGMKGYYETDFGVATAEVVDQMNERMGITPEQKFAMGICSMSGNWENFHETVSVLQRKRCETLADEIDEIGKEKK